MGHAPRATGTNFFNRERTTMTLQIVDGPTIAKDEALSDGADCSAGTIVRITVPQEYTPANLTFQVSTDGNFYNDLYTADGEEITIAAKPNTAIVLPAFWTKSIAFIKLRSGSRSHPVKQAEDCKFAIAIETDAGAGAGAEAARAGAPERGRTQPSQR
jgi:hypothetical protein